MDIKNLDIVVENLSGFLIDDYFDSVLEGMNLDAAKMIKDEDVKKARYLVKEAKKLKKAKMFKEAISNLNEAEKLIINMKKKVDALPETTTIPQKIASAFTPIFTLMPTERIKNFMIVPTGNNSYYIYYETERFTDHYSQSTSSSVKERLQLKFNLFLNNLQKTRRGYEELAKKYKNSPAKESFSLSEDLYEINNEIVTESYINNKKATESFNYEEEEEIENVMEAVLTTALEARLTKKDKENLPDEMFGIPSKRKFPLHDKDHIFTAIKFFKFAKESDRKELAENIIRRMKELDMPINFKEKSTISKYI